MNIAFFGTPNFAVPALREINNSTHNVLAVITGVAKRSGRGQKLNKTPIYLESENLGIPIIEVESFNDFQVSKDFKIEESLIQNEILEIRLTYSGGCAQHQFTLYTTQQYQKSLPPKLPLFLMHDTGGDACREIKQETLLFNIEDLKYDGQKTVQFIINQEYTVDYTY